jgi:hypothetical protein
MARGHCSESKEGGEEDGEGFHGKIVFGIVLPLCTADGGNVTGNVAANKPVETHICVSTEKRFS